MDYKIPSEVVELPSKGLLYSENTSLHTGKIEVRYPTAKEEDILTSKKLIQSGKIFKVLIDSVIVDKDISYDDLLVVDRDAILIMVRVMMYGSTYNFKQSCPRCGELNTKSVDVGSLEYSEFNEKLLSESNNGDFEYTLPTSKVKIKFRLLTSSDSNKIDSEVKNIKNIYSKSGKKSNIDPTSSVSLAHIITDVDGKTDYKTIYEFVSKYMLMSDIKDFRHYIKEISPSVDTSYFFDCDECGYEDSLNINIDSNFFWPET